MNVFTYKVVDWYSRNKRDLPWRNTTDPYCIWVSEIILQQTRVEQGKNYYLEFIKTFPTIKKLALAKEDEVLKLWQGLGYYSRARNLHKTARYINSELSGEFPETCKELLRLKGIGPYTAAAIASIAFGAPHPVVDGNVYRVLARYFGIQTPIDSGAGKSEFKKVAEKLIAGNDPGIHNQALMEFGALQCIPKSPDCTLCPIAENCYALQHSEVDKFPVKSKQTRQRSRYFYYYYFDTGESTFLQKRTEKDIWLNLYQFPLLESGQELNEINLLKKDSIPFVACDNFNIKSISPQKKHVLSHQIIYAKTIHVEIKNSSCINGDFVQVNKKDISTFAVPRLVENCMKDLKLI
jgi:A/G-specific adenine glycosylase